MDVVPGLHLSPRPRTQSHNGGLKASLETCGTPLTRYRATTLRNRIINNPIGQIRKDSETSFRLRALKTCALSPARWCDTAAGSIICNRLKQGSHNLDSSAPYQVHHSSASMTTRIQSVVVIGAGVSGIASAAHLVDEGLDVTVFERASVSGGVWSVPILMFHRSFGLLVTLQNVGSMINVSHSNPHTRLSQPRRRNLPFTLRTRLMMTLLSIHRRGEYWRLFFMIQDIRGCLIPSIDRATKD